jgi:hypothetical protein
MTRLLLFCVLAPPALSQQARVYMTEPHISPDRREVYFFFF